MFQVRQLRQYLGQRQHSLVTELATTAFQLSQTRREHGEQLGQEAHGLPAPVRAPESRVTLHFYAINMDGDMAAVSCSR